MMSSVQILPFNQYTEEYALALADKPLRYEGCWGRLQGWFSYMAGSSIYVYDEEATKGFYLRLDDLVTHLCMTSNTGATGPLLATSQKLHQLVLETLNPVIGKTIRHQDITALFCDFRSLKTVSDLVDSVDEAASIEIAANRLDELKYRHLEILHFDVDTLLDHLQPGDILFKKMPEDTSHIVVLGQKLIAPLISGHQDREGYKYSHASIYLGDGKIAEAVPDHDGSDVRILDLKHPKIALDSDSPLQNIQYMVARSSDPQLAKEAAEIALQVAQPAEIEGENGLKKTDFSYTKIHALRSIWHPSGFGPYARERYFKQYYYDRHHLRPKDFMGLKSFFCSYFVGYCFQTAESRRIMPAIVPDEDTPVRGYTHFGTALFREIWAKIRRLQLWKPMSEQVKYKFDAKRLTPQDFRNFMTNHPDLFKDIFLIRAAQGSSEAPPLSHERVCGCY
jgi:hypothetical protein